jgi:hypothetical protein
MNVQQIMQMLIEMKADRKAEELKNMMKAMREEIKSGGAEMRSIVNAWMTDIKAAPQKKRRPPATKRRRQIQRRLSLIEE